MFILMQSNKYKTQWTLTVLQDLYMGTFKRETVMAILIQDELIWHKKYI